MKCRNAFNWRCAYCGSKVTHETMEKDHVVALFLGGEESLRNVVPSCKRCNASKRESNVFNWLRATNQSIPGWLHDLLLEEWFVLAIAKTMLVCQEDD